MAAPGRCGRTISTSAGRRRHRAAQAVRGTVRNRSCAIAPWNVSRLACTCPAERHCWTACRSWSDTRRRGPSACGAICWTARLIRTALAARRVSGGAASAPVAWRAVRSRPGEYQKGSTASPAMHSQPSTPPSVSVNRWTRDFARCTSRSGLNGAPGSRARSARRSSTPRRAWSPAPSEGGLEPAGPQPAPGRAARMPG